MKVRLRDLTRTNLGFPSEWKGINCDGAEVILSYRYGHLKMHCEGEIVLDTGKDEFDVGGYMSDEELAFILKKHEMLEE